MKKYGKIKRTILGLLVCIMFLLCTCSNATVCKIKSTNENSFSKDSDRGDYSLGDIEIRFSPEYASVIINNVPPPVITVPPDSKWTSTLTILYACGFEYKFEVMIRVVSRIGSYIFFDIEKDFTYIGPGCPDDIYLEKSYTIPKGKNYVYNVWASISVAIYYDDNGYWQYLRRVEDSESHVGIINCPKTRTTYYNTYLFNYLENHLGLFMIFENLLQKNFGQ